MLALFPSMNYKQWVALGEMVDNSVQSFITHRDELRALHGDAFKLRIDIEFIAGKNPLIRVNDNAAGIAESDVSRAFTPAIPPGDKTLLSQHGIGMKSSSAWYANSFSIVSKALNETVERSVHFDVPAIIESNLEELSISEKRDLPLNTHYTRIELRQLHQPIPVLKTLGKIRSYIASIYRDFIRSGEVEIVVGGKVLEFETPELLNKAYWPTDKGPRPGSAPREWKIALDIELSDSWAADLSPNRPSRAPRVRGWMGILKDGSTQKSGAALVWRKKVVVGAGSLAEGNEDSYRPQGIFGASTTFPYQRLIGELDVSELQVTTFKDQVDWRPGQEDELQTKLKTLLRTGDEPMLRMAANYRSTLKSASANKTINERTKATVEAASPSIEVLTGHPSLPTELDPSDDGTISVSLEVPVPDEFSGRVYFEVVSAPGGNYWLDVVSDENNVHKIRVNRDHLFMQSFANLPGADLDPVLRLAIAVGLAEISGRISGIEFPTWSRAKINDILLGKLSSRIN
jgi:hypothetical protein